MLLFDPGGKQILNEWYVNDSPKGNQQFKLSVKDIANGAYFIKMKSINKIGVARIIIIK